MSLPTKETLRARKKLSLKFLFEVLVPEIQKGVSPLVIQANLPTLYESFVAENIGPGDDFELGHALMDATMFIAFNEKRENPKIKMNVQSVRIARDMLYSIEFNPDPRKERYKQ